MRPGSARRITGWPRPCSSAICRGPRPKSASSTRRTSSTAGCDTAPSASSSCSPSPATAFRTSRSACSASRSRTSRCGASSSPAGALDVCFRLQSLPPTRPELRGNCTIFRPVRPRPRTSSDTAHCSLLYACLAYLNMADFEPLGNGSMNMLPPASMPLEESRYLRKKAPDQRHLIAASYPFLQYAVDNWLYHLLSPRSSRYHFPQHELLSLMGCRPVPSVAPVDCPARL